MTDIHTIAHQLTHWHQHREAYHYEGAMSSWDAHHTTNVPPLLQQLETAQKRAAEMDYNGGSPTSKPAANIEAIDTLSHIDNEASSWIRKLGHDDPGTTIACVSLLHGLAASARFCGASKAVVEPVKRRVKIEGRWETRTKKEAVCCDAHRIERDMRRWWTQARICSGWDSLPWKPNNTCPHCEERRSLRIRPDDKTALCVNCRETWDSTNIGILAEHVRLENGEELAAS